MIIGVLLLGLLLIAAALKNTTHELGDQLANDMLGQQGFLLWAAAIGAIGALGYIPGLRTGSRYMLLLLAVVVILRNGGVWANAQAALIAASAAGPAPAVQSQIPASGSSGSGGGSSGGGSSGGAGGSGGISAGTVAQVAALALL